ncbi:MAG: hypothetical protein ACI841_003327 [Planctomycetota bacterium]|jgi:hypothetical protein
MISLALALSLMCISSESDAASAKPALMAEVEAVDWMSDPGKAFALAVESGRPLLVIFR